MDLRHADIYRNLFSGRTSSLMAVVLVLFDILIVAATFAVSVYVRHWAGGSFDLEFYWAQWPVVLLYALVLASFGGYDALITPAQEMRACSLATVLIVGAFSSLTFWVRLPLVHSRVVILFAGLMLMVLLPATHFCVKSFFSRFSWWGYRTIFYVFEKKEVHFIRLMIERLHFSLRPVLVLRHRSDLLDGEIVQGVPILDGPDFLFEKCPRVDSIFIFLGYPHLGSGARTVLRKAENRFSRTIILHESLNFGNQWAKPVDLGQHLGLEVMQRLLDTKRLAAKRCVDVLLALFLLVVLLPVFVLLALIITLSTPGPVFFRHGRLGRGGKPFKAWKFRTMVANADAVLKDMLSRSPEMLNAWENCHKLAKDPRITPVGRFLRNTSLDELPQLFNVIRGEMSLIGPRPIVQAEIEKYGESYKMVSKVRPGMTGLWQVSGRSRLTYAERVELDAYYIKNWSFWLDMYILLKTPLAVFKCSDAQ